MWILGLDMKNKKLSRDSGLEILRVLAMSAIIASHYFVHGIDNIYLSSEQVSHLSLWMTEEVCSLLAKVSNNIFFLITGFFLHKSHFSVKKYLLLLGQVLITNWVLLCVDFFWYGERRLLTLLSYVFPISFNMNWFVSAYLAVYTLVPFLKKATTYFRYNHLQYNLFIFVITLIVGLIGFITPDTPYFNGIIFGLYVVIWGDYVEYNKEKITKYPLVMIGILCFIFLVATRFILENYIGKYWLIVGEHSGHFEKNTSPIVLAIGICLLLIFSKLPFKSKVANMLSNATLTIYLIHDNAAFREHIWFNILQIQDHLDHMFMWLFFSVVIIFFSGFAIDFIRRCTIELIYKLIIAKPCDKIDEYVSAILS